MNQNQTTKLMKTIRSYLPTRGIKKYNEVLNLNMDKFKED